jgi:hypothetical protein
MVTQTEIAHRAGIDTSSVNKILNRRAGPRFRKDTVARVFRIARELGFDFSRLKHFHRREHDRRPADLAVEVTVRQLDGTAVEAGMGVLRELSPSGALLVDLHLPSGRLPLVPFDLVLRWKKGRGVEEARGRIVRLRLEEQIVAVQFATAPAPVAVSPGAGS